MQLAITAEGHMVKILRLNTGEVEVVAHGRPLQGDFTELEEAGAGAREPFLLEPVAGELLIAGRG